MRMIETINAIIKGLNVDADEEQIRAALNECLIN